MTTHDRFFLRALTLALCSAALSACTVITDPFEPSSDFTSSSSDNSSGSATKEDRVRVFAATNFDRLKADMAKGQGEHLISFASLLGVPPDQRATFYTFTQEKFSVLFPTQQVTPDEMVATLTHELSSHPGFHPGVAMN